MMWTWLWYKWGIKAGKDDLGCQSIHYSLWHLTVFTLHLPCVPEHRVSFPLCCLALKFTLKLLRNQGAWMENRFYDKVGTPLAWWCSRNQSEISPFGIVMKGDICMCRNTFLLICRDTFRHWLPGGLWRRRVLLLCTRNSSHLLISDSINAYFLQTYCHLVARY